MASIVLTGLAGGPTGTTSVPTVTAYDSGGRVALGYSGQVSFSSTDPNSLLPAAYTFSRSDNGVHTFSSPVTLITPTSVSVTALATSPSVSSTQSNLPVSAAYNYTLSPNTNTGVCLELAKGLTAASSPVTVDYCTAAMRQNVRQDSNNNLIVMGQCIAPVSAASGAAIAVQACNAASLQKWTQNTAHQYVLAANPNLCLDAVSGAVGTQMQVTTCSSAQSQVFLQKNTPPVYSITGVRPNTTFNYFKRLDVAGGSTAQGTAVGQYQINQYTTQRFLYGTDGTLTFLGRCVEVPGSPPASGAQPVLNACTGAATQKFIFSGDNVMPATNTNLCLDLTDQSSYNVYFNTCNGSAGQLVGVTSSAYYYRFVPLSAQTSCLHSMGNGQPINVGACDVNSLGSFTYLNYYDYLDAQLAGSNFTHGSNGQAIQVNGGQNNATAWQHLALNNPNGYFQFGAGAGNANNCIDASAVTSVTPATCNATAPAQNFAMPTASVKFALSSNTSLCVGYAGGYLSNTPLQLQTCDPASGAQTFNVDLDSSLRFAGLCATSPQGATANASIIQAPCFYDATQAWAFTNFNTVTYQSNSNYCWTAASATVGAAIQLQTCTSSALQLFTFY